METFSTIVFPIFGIILSGYICGRAGLFSPGSSAVLNAFVYYVAFPALFFLSMAAAPVGDILNWPYVTALIGGQLITFLLAWTVARLLFPARVAVLGLHSVAAIFPNAGYLGIPLLVTAFGQAGALPAVIATVLNGALIMALGLAIVEWDFSRQRGSSGLTIFRDVATNVIRNPLLLSAFAGMACSALGTRLPGPIDTFVRLLSAAAGPTALFSIGLFLVGQQIRQHLTEVGWITVLKLLINPAVTWVLAEPVLKMPPVWAVSAVLIASLPTAGLVFVLAEKYQIFVRRSAAVIFLTTTLSAITVSAVLAYFLPSVPR